MGHPPWNTSGQCTGVPGGVLSVFKVFLLKLGAVLDITWAYGFRETLALDYHGSSRGYGVSLKYIGGVTPKPIGMENKPKHMSLYILSLYITVNRTW